MKNKKWGACEKCCVGRGESEGARIKGLGNIWKIIVYSLKKV